MAELTPMMKQYMQVKKECPDAILMFRLGDFYEMFFEDAKTASRELELTLTGRSCGQEERAPMCGVPFHAADSYITRLVAKGYKVAVCEQTEDPKATKNIVKREIVRVVTPGTVLDDGLLDARGTNYMASICFKNETGAVCFADVSTGELLGTVIDDDISCDKLINELARFSPVEIAVGGTPSNPKKLERYLAERTNALVFEYDAAQTEQKAAEILTELTNAADIADDLLKTAAAALLDYILQTQKAHMAHMRKINVYASAEFTEIDAACQRNLELTETMRDKAKRGTLFWVLDKTKTAMGSRMIKKWILRPLVNAAAINNRLCGVEELVKNAARQERAREMLAAMYDMERLISRISMGSANARDLAALRSSMEYLPQLKMLLAECESRILKEQEELLDPLEDLKDLLDRAIVDEPPLSLRDGGLIRVGFNEEIDRLRDAAENGRGYITRIEACERERTGIKNLKVKFNKVFGYYIEVSNSNLSKVPPDYVRKQTLTNGERYITAELKEVESTVLGAAEKLVELEYAEFVAVRTRLCDAAERIAKTAHAVAVTDALCSLAFVAAANDYSRPEVDMSDVLYIKDGRHPVVEKMLSDSLFVPNDTDLDCAHKRTAIITGPNMAGKSTYMRQSALIVLMAQMGSFVPAKSARIGITDKIFTRIGASDDLASGQSTFMLEMSEVSYILKNATPKSLCLLDEIGRGTSTFDGLSIAWAVVEHINKKIGAKTLFATHYHELTALEETTDGIVNFNTACKKHGDEITFLRRIVRGGTDDSFGIEVAKLAGVPDGVIRRAKEILKEVESGEKGAVQKPAPQKEEAQLSFEAVSGSALAERLRQIDVTTLTPIEALNKLYELQKLI